jgi:orotidine-5'-phosphate decarboxylase
MMSDATGFISSESSSSSSSSFSTPSYPYRSRIINSAQEKKSPIILALDYFLENFNNNNKNLFKKCKEIVSSTASQICAIKINFHLLLSLTNIQILELNFLAHKLNLQSIADIKLNDIGNTNKVTVTRLQRLGFDAVIVNPFIGITEMKSLVSYAHSINFGIISLVYMSHPSSFEGYGLNVVIPSSSNFSSFSSSSSSASSSSSSSSSSSLSYRNTDNATSSSSVTTNTNNNDIEKSDNANFNKNVISMYHLLYNYAFSSDSDGIVIGATHLNIIKEISQLDHYRPPIYSPGFVTQGGSIKESIKAGTDYFIIGRHIINSTSPAEVLDSLIEEIRKYKKN